MPTSTISPYAQRKQIGRCTALRRTGVQRREGHGPPAAEHTPRYVFSTLGRTRACRRELTERGRGAAMVLLQMRVQRPRTVAAADGGSPASGVVAVAAVAIAPAVAAAAASNRCVLLLLLLLLVLQSLLPQLLEVLRQGGLHDQRHGRRSARARARAHVAAVCVSLSLPCFSCC